jgi:ParB family chromosome partitioning protein
MADWWEPSAEGFLNHISKSQIVQVLKEARPDLGLRDVEGMKKNALARTAEGYLKGKRWLPPTLRLPAS